LDILHLFGEASGLKTNVQKSTVVPIHCLEEHRTLLQTHLPCQISEFPCKYLGVPHSPHKLTKAPAQPIIERIADRLPSWKAELLTKAGRSVFSAVCAHFHNLSCACPGSPNWDIAGHR